MTQQTKQFATAEISKINIWKVDELPPTSETIQFSKEESERTLVVTFSSEKSHDDVAKSIIPGVKNLLAFVDTAITDLAAMQETELTRAVKLEFDNEQKATVVQLRLTKNDKKNTAEIHLFVHTSILPFHVLNMVTAVVSKKAGMPVFLKVALGAIGVFYTGIMITGAVVWHNDYRRANDKEQREEENWQHEYKNMVKNAVTALKDHFKNLKGKTVKEYCDVFDTTRGPVAEMATHHKTTKHMDVRNGIQVTVVNCDDETAPTDEPKRPYVTIYVSQFSERLKEKLLEDPGAIGVKANANIYSTPNTIDYVIYKATTSGAGKMELQTLSKPVPLRLLPDAIAMPHHPNTGFQRQSSIQHGNSRVTTGLCTSFKSPFSNYFDGLCFFDQL